MKTHLEDGFLHAKSDMDKWFLSNLDKFLATGSQLIKKSCRDFDFVLPVDLIPDGYREIIFGDSGEEYTDSFFNLKVGVFDFIISNNEDYAKWEYATKKMIDYKGDMPIKDKEIRVALFERWKSDFELMASSAF